MKKEFAKRSTAEQEEAELEYHRMQPEQFENLMAGARPNSPDVIRLPRHLVETLKNVAKTEGEPEYKTMVRRWLEERLQQETKLATRSSKKSSSKKSSFRRIAVK